MSSPKKPGRAWRILRRTGLGLVALIVLAFIGFTFLFESAGDEVDVFCRAATPGLPVAQLVELARKHELRLVPAGRDEAGVQSLLAHSPKSFGRHTCRVRHDGSRVIDSRPGFAD